MFVFFFFLFRAPATFVFFFFNDPAPPEIYPLSLHDALPISAGDPGHLGAGLPRPHAPAEPVAAVGHSPAPDPRVPAPAGAPALPPLPRVTGPWHEIGRAHV